jgi:hypothetical protein
MSRLLLDASLAENLLTVSDAVEIVDNEGRVLGVYTPVFRHVPPPGFVFPFSDEEMARSRLQTTGRSLDEILRDLKQKYGE